MITTDRLTVNGKELRIMATATFDEIVGPIMLSYYSGIAFYVLQKLPVDMLIFEMNYHGKQQVRLAGYNFLTHELDEETIAYKANSSFKKTFWFKVDDYGDYYTGTFLFPEEY